MTYHGYQRFLVLVAAFFWFFPAPLSANFESLIQGLGFNRDIEIRSIQQKISSLFVVTETPNPSHIKMKSKNKNQNQEKRNDLETQILDFHQKCLLLQISDKEIWKGFLLDLACFQNIDLSVHQAFRKNQILNVSKRVYQLQEKRCHDLGEYFTREKPQMIAKSLETLKRMEDEYRLFFGIHEFIARYWLNQNAEFSLPLLNLGVNLAKAKLIHDEFEHAKRGTEKESENKGAPPSQDTTVTEGPTEKEIPSSSLQEPKEKETLSPLKTSPEITLDDFTLTLEETLEQLKDHILLEEVYSWDRSRPLTHKEVLERVKKYQDLFDEMQEAAFPKLTPMIEKIPDETELKEEEIQEKGKEKELEIENKEKLSVPYIIPSHLKVFRHSGIFELLKRYQSFEVADKFLFLKTIQILQNMSKISPGDDQKITKKLNLKWSLHVSQGKEKNLETETLEGFLKAFSNWKVANQELEGPRIHLVGIAPLKEKYDHFIKMQGSAFQAKITAGQEKEAEQLLNAVVLGGWGYHQSTCKKQEPKEKVKILEVELRNLWGQSSA